ncbi:hypothetical protein ACET3Z_028959 [Daucus carota]
MANNGQEAGGSGGSSSRRGRRSGKKEEPKVRQRGLGIAQLEFLRRQAQMAPASGWGVIPNQLHVPPFRNPPVAAPALPGGQGLMGGLNNFQIHGASSRSLWHTSHPAPSSANVPQTMSMGSEGCDLELRLSTSTPNEDKDLELRPPNYFTSLLLAEDSEEEKETGQAYKRARTDASVSGSSAAPGSSSKEEPDLELRLSVGDSTI